MLKKRILEQLIFRNAAVLSATFTAAVTDIITSAAHGLQDEDIVRFTTSDTLPAGLSADTDYYVRDRATNTFKVSLTPGGTAVNITSTGSGTHTLTQVGRKIRVGQARNVNFFIAATDTPSFTIKFKKSDQEDVNFANAQSATNRWSYADVRSSDGGSVYDGSTGIVITTNTFLKVILEDDYAEFVSAEITWTSGKLGLTVTGSQDNNY